MEEFLNGIQIDMVIEHLYQDGISNKRYNYANQNLNTNDHRNAGNLDTVFSKRMQHTLGTPGAISSDIQAFYDSDGKGMSAARFCKFL